MWVWAAGKLVNLAEFSSMEMRPLKDGGLRVVAIAHGNDVVELVRCAREEEAKSWMEEKRKQLNRRTQ